MQSGPDAIKMNEKWQQNINFSKIYMEMTLLHIHITASALKF